MDPKVILAELCAKAPNTDVRNCIRKYNLASGKNYKALESQFNGTNVVHLIETLKYLKAPNLRPNLNDYTKSGLVFGVITRIEGFFMNTCNTCDAEYRMKIDDPSVKIVAKRSIILVLQIYLIFL